MHGANPLRQAVDFSGCTKTCAMMREVSPLRRQARERMALNLLKISGLMQCPPLGFPYKEGYLIY